MAIDLISIKGFRNIIDSTLKLNKFNIIHGNNGSGKTSLLEALFFLGRGKSFRTNKVKNLINISDNNFTIFSKSKITGQIGIRKNISNDLEIKINHEYTRNISSLSKNLPIQIILPNCHLLIEGAPNERRKYIDWLVFHVKHELIPLWKKHQKILRQRNLALKNRLPKNQITIWDNELIRITEIINLERIEHIKNIGVELNKLSKIIFKEKITFLLKYNQSWDKKSDFGSSLKSYYEKDRDRGFTNIGLNKSELKIYSVSDNNTKYDVKEFLSKGNLKLLAVILVLVQLKIFIDNRKNHIKPILLIDDIFAELDETHVKNILSVIFNLDLQTFITTVNDPNDGRILKSFETEDLSMFHVKQGNFYLSNN